MTSHFFRSRHKLTESATLVANVHVTPETDSEEPTHVLNGWCWCQPLVERELMGDIYIHRRSLDHPHIEVEA